MDFFTVPTVTFSVLYCFFVISHHRRRILHCNVTSHPTSLWIVQQLREAFPCDSAPRSLIFDREAKYGLEVPAVVRSLNICPVQTSFESPWQNGIAERWVGSRGMSQRFGLHLLQPASSTPASTFEQSEAWNAKYPRTYANSRLAMPRSSRFQANNRFVIHRRTFL